MMAGKDEALNIVFRELEALRLRIIDNHIKAGQKASGKTISSLRIQMYEDGGALFGRNAFEVLETGRKGGPVPRGFYQIIKDWVKAKNIQVDKPNVFAYFVARKIAREGTSLYREGSRDDIYSRDIEKTTRNIMEQIFGVFEKDIDHINLHNYEDE